MKRLLAFILLTASCFAQFVASPGAISTPTTSPGAGTYSTTQSVTINALSGSYVCYTTDGSTPAGGATGCTTGSHYTGAFNVAATTTVKAKAFKPYYLPSAVMSEDYTISGGGGGGSDPTSLTGLVWWFKADSLALSNNASVSSWSDSSGNSHTATQGTGLNQPVFLTNQINSLPAISSDNLGGNNQYLSIASPTTFTSGTVFVVFEKTSANWATFMGNASALFGLVWRANGVGSAPGQKLDNTNGDLGSSTHGISTSTWYIADATWDNSTGYAFRLLQSGTMVADGSGAAAGSISANTDTLFYSLSEASTGLVVAEIFAYSRVLNGTEIGQMETYLKTKYGL